MLKVSSTKQLFDNWLYVRNPRNVNYDDLPFDGDEILITREWIDRINDDIIERPNNSSVFDIYMNRM